ncbi:MAG: TonB-dependent receptor, partial [Flavitalea sp.]
TVGNAPPAYASAITYTQTTLPTSTGPVPSLSVQPNAGNNQIRPENKYDAEAGLEVNMLKNRLGFDFTYYNSRVIDQIVQLTVPASTGAISKLINAGELRSTGFEASIHGRPVSNKNFNWDVVLNIGSNKTKVRKLGNGVKEVVYFSGEQNAARVVAVEGERVGDIYVYPRLTNNKGEYVIGSNGLYVIDNSKYMKVGNIMPRLIGGISNSINWNRFSLECMIDYRFGGEMVSPAVKYNIGAGMFQSTMQFRDAEHGGLPYYLDNAGVRVLLASHQSTAPAGQQVQHDGILLEGVDATGTKNNTLTDAASYYMNMYGWGPNSLNENGMVFRNSYVKMRELVVTYKLPAKNLKKALINEVHFSLIGRNLFYFYRTLKHIDPETAIGSSWSRQGIDEGSMAANRSIGFAIRARF